MDLSPEDFSNEISPEPTLETPCNYNDVHFDAPDDVSTSLCANFPTNAFDEAFQNTNESLLQNRKHAMLLSPILKCVFGFLSVEQIKIIRLVCQEWNSTGKTILKNRATILFYPHRRLEDFYSCFPDLNVPFTAFKFSSGTFSYQSFRVEELEKFFSDHGKSIKKLRFLGMHLSCNDNGNILKSFEISPWIAKTALSKPGGQYVTKLKIKSLYTATKLSMSWKLLSNVKEISLQFCKLIIEDGVQICPATLKLKDVIFCKDGIELPNVALSQVADLSKTKKISLQNFHQRFTEMTLDLNENASLDKLSLTYTDSINWETAKWSVKKLIQFNVPCIHETKMAVKEFNFCRGVIDLLALPSLIERLRIENISLDTHLVCTQPIVLPNLQFLDVETCHDFGFLSHFKNCHKLTDLVLRLNISAPHPDRNSEFIPKSVENLEIKKGRLTWCNDRDCAICRQMYR